MRRFLNQETIKRAFPFFLVTKKDGEIVEMGRSLRRLLPESSTGKSLLDLFTIERPTGLKQLEDFEKYQGKMLILREAQKGFNLMGQVISLGREKVFIFIVNLLIKDSEEVSRLGLTFEDFAIQDQVFDFLMLVHTQRRATKEALELNQRLREANKITLQASEMKSHFLANMSHELRTPMNGVLGMASVLLSTDLADEQRDYLNTIISSGEHMLGLINDILDITKIEAGHLELENAPIQIQNLIENVYDKFRAEIATKEVEHHLIIETDTPQIFNGDEKRINQILINLIGNSMKFTHAGEISLRVSRAPSKGSQNGIKFVISDTGIGMDRKTLEKIFNPFMQGDISMTKKFGGTGLGLSICKKLAHLMSGEISVKSEIGRGSEFTVLIYEPEQVAAATTAAVGK